MMATSISSDNVSGKKKCPYMEKCYRKNPIHFNEMSHPHLEKIVINQLHGEIQIPEKLDFECSDKSLLMDQLKVLQMVLRKQSNITTSSAKAPNIQVSGASSSVSNEDSNLGKNFKDKIERHKQIMSQRRESKLKTMDEQGIALFKAKNGESSNNNPNTIGTMKEELSKLNITEEQSEPSCSSQDKKRDSSSFKDSGRENKKSKSNHNRKDEVKECIQRTDDSQGCSSLKGKSLIEAFNSCDSMKSRWEHREKAIEMMKKQGYKVSVVEPGNFALKYALSAPYHMFFTRIQNSRATYDQPLCITFPEILDRSLGEIENSLHINFMVDVGWLCLQYLLAAQRNDMLIILGERVDEEKLGSNITLSPIYMPKFGCHHTKISILKYKDDGIRVVVSTANLYSHDWENRTQGLWISPHLPPLPESANTSDGESPTGFKKDFLLYLNKYRLPFLTEWTCAVRRADFSSVNVFFLASVPGRHKGVEYDSWGHRKLGSVLSKHAVLPPDAPQWTLVAQSSSIGSLGPCYESWLLKDVVSSMSKESPSSLKSHPNFQFIYPTIKNYKESFDCRVASCCLPYSLQTHSKQEWFERYMYQWKATRTAMDKAMPHIKSYTRFSPDMKRIPWFVLTSANLSKAAWGNAIKDFHSIMNYEGGVIFIPKFVTGSTSFPIKEEENGVQAFPIPYDLPPVKYESDDKPFVMEFFST